MIKLASPMLFKTIYCDCGQTVPSVTLPNCPERYTLLTLDTQPVIKILFLNFYYLEVLGLLDIIPCICPLPAIILAEKIILVLKCHNPCPFAVPSVTHI